MEREGLLEHDDAADEGDPESGAPGGGVAEKMSQFEIHRKLRRIEGFGVRSEGLRRKYYSDGEKNHRR